MEPENRAQPLFEDFEDPVAPAYVQQLVTGDRLLHVVGHRQDGWRNDDDRRAQAEGDRSSDAIGDVDTWPNANPRFRLTERRGRRHER